MIERVLHREHPTPRLTDHDVPRFDAQVACQPYQFVLEQLWLPEVDGRVRQVRALAATQLVVQNTRAPEAAQIGDGLAVVVRGPGPTVADHDGRILGSRIEITDDAVPRLVPVPHHPSLAGAHLTLLRRGWAPWRRARERSRSAKWVMACRKASAAEGGKRRPFPPADVGRVATARMEPTSRRRVNRARYLSLEHDPAPRRWRALLGVDEWDRGEERLGVRMNRALVEDVHRRLLDDHAEVHDGDPVRDVADDAEIVRDEDVGEPELVLEVVEEVDDLGLDRHVERGDRLVGDDQPRIQGERTRDADPLSLPARELVRIAVDVGRGEADDLQELPHTLGESRHPSRGDGSATDHRRSARPASGDSTTRTGPGRRSASRAGTVSARCVSAP